MSDAIRNAIIKLSLEFNSPSIKLPDFGPAIAQQNTLAEAIAKVEAASLAAAKASQSTAAAAGTAGPSGSGVGQGSGPSTESIANTEKLTAAIASLEAALSKSASAASSSGAAYTRTGNAAESLANAKNALKDASLKEQAAQFQLNSAIDYETTTGKKAYDLNILRNNVREAGANVAKAQESVERATTAAIDAATAAEKRRQAATLRMQAASDQFTTSLMGVGRGLAYVAAGNSDALSKALPYLFATEGLYGVTKNLMTASRSLVSSQVALVESEGLAAAATSTLTAATTALKTSILPLLEVIVVLQSGIAIATAAYDTWTYAEKKKKMATDQARESDEKASEALASQNERMQISSDTLLEKIGYLDTVAEKEMALEGVLAKRGEAEARVDAARRTIASGVGPGQAAGELEGALIALSQQKVAAKELLDISKQRAESEVSANKQFEERLGLQSAELEKAKELLRMEDDRSLSLRAGIGALKDGEKSRLKRAVESAEAGTLNKREAVAIERSGGTAGRRIADAFFEKLDGGLGARLEKIAAKVREESQKTFENRTDVKNIDSQIASKDAKILELEGQNSQIIDMQKRLQSDLRESFTGIANEMSEIKKEISIFKGAATVSRAVKR